MPAKIFIDLATKPFVADVVFPNGLPPGGFVTLFVGCCQKTPQPGKVVDSIIVPKSSTSVPVIRKTCHNQTYTEFCDGKIFVRNDVANFQVAAHPCSLRSSTSSPVLTSQEHGRLHIQKEVPDLCGNIVPFPKSEFHYCHRCSFFSLLREEKLHHDSVHGGSRQQCLLCRRFFKNGTTLNQHLCLHLQRCVRCDVCSRIFSSKEARARHLERNCDAPPVVEPTRPLIKLLPPPPPPPPPEPVVVEVAPAASTLIVEVPSPPNDTACASASVSPLPETQTPPHKQTDQGGKQPKVKSLQIRRTRHPCPYCPRFCFSMGAYQAHLRRKHINMAPLKCPRCPKRFFLDHQFYKHRSICLRKAKGLKGTPYSPKNRWNRLNCEHCEFFTHRYKLLTNHYAKEHKEHALSTCTQCNAVFAHYAFMLAHQVQVHFDPEDAHPKECSLCSTQLESVDALRDHVLAIHAAALIYRCIECHERFMTLSILLQHREEKHNPKSRKCPECPKEFSTSVACRRHVMYTHYSSRLRFPCKYCFRRYKDLLNLHYHMALSHIHELSEEEKKSLVAVKRRCQQCDYETYNRRSMQGHMRRSHGSLLQCRQCEQKFSLPAELTRHMRLRHSAQGRQDCPHCTRSFVCPKAHALHVTMHQDGSGHECAKCKRLFESEALLKHHQESHLSDAKGRRCQVCLRCFTTPRRLAEHQATFRSKEPGSEGQLTCANVRKVPAKKRDRRDLKIQCDKCHLRFKYQSSWQAHCMSAHGKRPTNADSGYTCEICKHTFVSVLGLSNHIRSHTGERPFRCKECGAAFLQPGTLKEHVVLKHSRAFRNSCPFCNKGFVGKNKLRRHLQAAHKAVVVRSLPAAPRRPPVQSPKPPASSSQTAPSVTLRDSREPDDDEEEEDDERAMHEERSAEDATDVQDVQEFQDVTDLQGTGAVHLHALATSPRSAVTPTFVILRHVAESVRLDDELQVALQVMQLVPGVHQVLPEVLAVPVQHGGGASLAVAVDSIIKLMVCDTLVETSCVELSTEPSEGQEDGLL